MTFIVQLSFQNARLTKYRLLIEGGTTHAGIRGDIKPVFELHLIESGLGTPLVDARCVLARVRQLFTL
jgi:hypothetical protein